MQKLGIIFVALFITGIGLWTHAQIHQQETAKKMSQEENKLSNENLASATFGAGCFWCVEAVFQELEGVEKVISGYTGGVVKNPSYKEICTGMTGHAEVCRIYYDDAKIGYADLLEVFWATHDPTTANRQGNDVGTQYRSAIYYHDEDQKNLALKSMEAMNESGIWINPIVTEISPLPKFYEAEDYHQDYFNLNPNQPYCSAIVGPKVDKFKKKFREKLKQNP